MNVEALLELVKAVNTTTSLAMNLGISISELAAAQRQAQLEGRDFDVRDVRRIKENTERSLNRLEEAIREAEKRAEKQ